VIALAARSNGGNINNGQSMSEFISEDTLQTFEGWLRSQNTDMVAMTEDQLGNLKSIYEENRKLIETTPPVGRMKLPPLGTEEYRYAVAVREGAELWLALWVKRSTKGEFFVFMPRRDRSWDVHISYHRNGAVHVKSHDHKVLTPQQHQPLTVNGDFHGAVHLGYWKGYGPKTVGAVCHPGDFSGVVEVAPNVLGPFQGSVAVDLVEPGTVPTQEIPYSRIITRETFRDFSPWVVITVGADQEYK